MEMENKQQIYLEAFSSRFKTVFKKTNCPDAVVMPQVMSDSKDK